MALFPEKEPELPVSEVPEAPEIPEYIEKKVGVTSIPTQPTGVVQDKTSPTTVVTLTTVQIPADQATLASWSKGPITSSLTWFAAFWLRIIKKAFHFGWRIVKGGS